MMASADEGYEDDRFETAVPDNFRCAICLNVLRQPMQCQRNEHSFCRPCILRYLQEYERCPSCMEPLTLQTLRPSRVIKNLMSQLKIKCDNVQRGCPDTVNLENLEGHVVNCEFSPVKCSNEGCEVIMNRKDQAHHENNECIFRKGKCEVCGENVANAKRKLHCYVTKTEMDEVREEISSIKEEISTMKEDISTIKEIVVNISGELTQHIGRMKDQMVEMKCEIDKIKKEVQSAKQEPQSSIRSPGPPITYLEHNVNIREDIIIAGGLGLVTVEKFCWSTRQWSFLSTMTSERWFSSSCVRQAKMFVFGGVGEETMETLELKKEGGEWKKLETKLPKKTYAHASTVYEDYLFIFGGKSDVKVVKDISKVGLLSPYSSQLVSHLPEAICRHGAQRFGDKVAIVGGTTTGYRASGSLDKVLLYDITRNCCRALAPLPFPVSAMATVARGDDIVIIGGRDKEGNALNTVVSYNIKQQKSKMLPSMKHKRSSCTAVGDR